MWHSSLIQRLASFPGSWQCASWHPGNKTSGIVEVWNVICKASCDKAYYRRSGNFCCKNIFVVCAYHENKKHKYILQQIIIIVRTFLFAQFHSTASYFAQDGLFYTSISLELMPNAKQLFIQCRRNRLSLLPQYVPTALLGSLLHASSSPTAAW